MVKRPYNRRTRKDGTLYPPTRSVRVDDEVWAKVGRRAAYEGVTISHVIYTFLQGYAEGMINLPRIRTVYTQHVEVLPPEPVQSNSTSIPPLVDEEATP